MLEPVVGGHLLVINRQLARLDAALVLLCWMGPELTCEHVQDLLAHPPALGERREGKVVRIDFPKACQKETTTTDREADERNGKMSDYWICLLTTSDGPEGAPLPARGLIETLKWCSCCFVSRRKCNFRYLAGLSFSWPTTTEG